MLERSVGLDPSYAAAWSTLGTRYYYSAALGGVASDFERSAATHEKALSLDPNLTTSSQGLIVLDAEKGDLVGAYAKASDLVRRRPQDSRARFALAYVLRYAGLLDEAARECEQARRGDPGNRNLRSCGVVYMYMNDDREGGRLLPPGRGIRIPETMGRAAPPPAGRSGTHAEAGRQRELRRLGGDPPVRSQRRT